MARKQNLRICQLTSGHSLDDERILHRFARSAAELGFESTVVGPDDGKFSFPGVSFVPCPKTQGKPTFWQRWLSSFNLFWWAFRNRRDAYQIHDPDMLLSGLALRLLGRCVIYDVHDDYEASFKDRFRLRGNYWLAKWFPRAWWWFEGNAARAFNRVIVADRHLAQKFSICDPVVLGNYPRIDFTEAAGMTVQETFNLIYIGGVTRARGVKVALDSLKRLPIPELRLHVIGSGGDEELNDELEADPRVVLHGRVPWTQLHEHLAKAHLGVALYQPLAGFVNVDHSVKIVEYMAAGIPILCSNFPGLKMFVEDSGCGLIVQPDDPDLIAEKINELLQDDSLRSQLGKMGRKLFERQYNWEKHTGKLMELYESAIRR